MKTVFRIMPFVILPFTINFPTVSPSFLSYMHSCCCSSLNFLFLQTTLRRCSPTGWPLTASHSVKSPCSDTRWSERSWGSLKGSNTLRLHYRRTTDLLKAWRRVGTANTNQLNNPLLPEVGSESCNSYFFLWVFRLEERTAGPTAGRERKEDKKSPGPRC